MICASLSSTLEQISRILATKQGARVKIILLSQNDAILYGKFCLNTLRACGSGSYNIENLRWKCVPVKTNKAPTTFMRAPGEMAPLFR